MTCQGGETEVQLLGGSVIVDEEASPSEHVDAEAWDRIDKETRRHRNEQQDKEKENMAKAFKV